MYRIARALKHQRLRKQFPKGVALFVGQTGVDPNSPLRVPIFTLKAKPLHKDVVLDVLSMPGYMALAALTHEMWDIQARLEEASVKVSVPKI